ncbi:hypothetical protein [Pseudidiomarina aestuarii]|uniref:hypothetical protein n=1 Tax=Pseudidiomarina aestuarii TaxID=624146 RepID=UPI003A979C4B
MSLTRKESNWDIIQFQVLGLLVVIVMALVYFINTMSETKEDRLLGAFYIAEYNPCTNLIDESGAQAQFENLGYIEESLVAHELAPNRFAVAGEFVLRKYQEEDIRNWYFVCDLEFDEVVDRANISSWSLLYGSVYGPARINPIGEYVRRPFKKNSKTL